MKILFLEPFFGGSHKDVALGFARHSAHEVEILSMPPRFWKWRMRGASLHLVRKVKDLGAYDLIFATDMLDLTDFKALAGPDCPPVVFYFHENQLSYPLGPHEKRDFHLGFTNIISAHAANLVLFNSRFHRDDFFKAARILIKQMPDCRPSWLVDEIGKKTRVLYPGCDLPAAGPDGFPGSGEDGSEGLPPLVIWNHRWEYDKDPEAFFRVLERVRERGAVFRLAVMGERYDLYPDVFDRARKIFAREIAAWGFQEGVEGYRAWLSQGACVVSTAIQENFGISVVEAVAQGCFPFLPKRLSYPELIPEGLHEKVIYEDEAGLEEMLFSFLGDPSGAAAEAEELSAHVRRFSWDCLIRDWDAVLESAAIK